MNISEADIRRFSPRMKDFYRRGLMTGLDVLREAGILDNGQRFSHFMGQFGAETAGGAILRESLHYTTVGAIRKAWRARASRYDDAWIKANLLRNPIALGDWAYGGRMGNRKGTSDGYDFRGGGWLQTTGRDAVDRYCKLCGISIRPDILDDPGATLKFACAEWQKSGCNDLADANDILGISKAINTGSATSGVHPNGMAERQAWFAKARAIWWDANNEDAPADAEPVSTSLADLHGDAHASLMDSSLLYKANKWNLNGLKVGAVGVFAFAQDHALEIGGAVLAAVVLFEIFQFMQRKSAINGGRA